MDTESSSARISKPETHRGRSRTAPLTLGRVAMVTCDQSSFFYFRGSAQKRKKDCLIAGYRSYYFVNLNFMLKWLKFACMTRLHFALWVRSLSFWLGKMGFAARLFFLARGFFPRLKKTDSLLCRNFSVMTKKWRLSSSLILPSFLSSIWFQLCLLQFSQNSTEKFDFIEIPPNTFFI